MKAVNRFIRIASIHEVIPFRNEIAQWASAMTEGNTAIHATTSLLLQMFH